jgi:hypothetical protein
MSVGASVGADVGAEVGVLEPQADKSSASKTPNINKTFILIETVSIYRCCKPDIDMSEKKIYLIKKTGK